MTRAVGYLVNDASMKSCLLHSDATLNDTLYCHNITKFGHLGKNTERHL
jgi:hypothetical protein